MGSKAGFTAKTLILGVGNWHGCLPRELWRYRVSLRNVADLTGNGVLAELGLPDALLSGGCVAAGLHVAAQRIPFPVSGQQQRFLDAMVPRSIRSPGASLRWRVSPRLCGGGHLMPEPAATNDHIERASTQFWNPPSLEELMADVAPLAADEHFDIPDLTDEEWEAFVAALDE
jgi:hypothetical protein